MCGSSELKWTDTSLCRTEEVATGKSKKLATLLHEEK